MSECKCGGESLVCEALKLIDGDRNNDYGDFGTEAIKLAAGFSALLGCTVSPDSVPLLLMWLKMVRQSHKHKQDNLVDLVGYAILLSRMHSDGQAQFAVDPAGQECWSDYVCEACNLTSQRSSYCLNCLEGIPDRSTDRECPCGGLLAAGGGCPQCGELVEGPEEPAQPSVRKTRVYVAGPYTIGNKQANTNAAIDAAGKLIKLGYWAYPPHWTHYLNQIHPQSYDFWMEYDLPLLLFCDAVLRLPGESKGADHEVSVARSVSKPVFESIDELASRLPLQVKA